MSDTKRRREKGSGSVWYDENRKRWIGQFLVGYKADGKKKLRTVSGRTQKEVKDILKEEQAKLLTGTYIDLSLITIPQMAAAINDEKYQMNITKDTAYIRAKDTIKIIENSSIGGIPIQKLNEMSIKSFLMAQTDYSNSVISKIYMIINGAMEKAVKQNIIRYNFVKDIKRPKSNKETKKIRALTVDEQKKVIEALNKDNKEPYRTMLLLSMFTGMRMGEICALDINNVNIPFSTIVVERTITRNEKDEFVLGETTKTKAGTRNIKMSEQVKEIINHYISDVYASNDLNLLFTKKGKLISTNQINSYFKRLIKRYGISDDNLEFNQHMLRHTFATRCIESGMSAPVLQKKLGHTDIQTTLNTYTDIFDAFEDKQDDLVNIYLQQQGLKFDIISNTKVV